MKHALPLLVLLALVLPAQVQARPVAATLSPSGAMVTEEETFRPEQGRVTLVLPAGADAGSLSFSLSAGSVLESHLSTRHSPSPAAAALQNERETLQNALSGVAAERESIAYERLFWADPPLNPASGDSKALEKLAKDTQSRLDALARREVELDARQRALERDLRALEKRMEALGENNDTVQMCVLVLKDEGPVTVRWSYYLPDAAWRPRYRVLADENAGRVRVFMDAELHQTSGTDWKDVDVTLSSGENFRSVNPPSLPDWIIGEARPAALRSMNIMAAKAPADASTAAAHDSATGTVWKLGAMNLPAEGTVTRSVASHECSASFMRLARPAEDERVWLSADIDDKTMPYLPSGQAVFSVDGVENARGVFRFGPGQEEIFFGVDALMAAKVQDLPAKAGSDAGAGRRTQQWRRSMTIVNGHDREVAVRVEASAPIVRDTSARVTVTGSPEAVYEHEGSRCVWMLDVPAKESSRIVYEVTVTEPDRKNELQRGQ